MVTREEFDQANLRAARLRASTPKAVGARYDERRGRVAVLLDNGLEVAFSPQNAQGFEKAKPRDLRSIEITPSGFGLHFPKIDADLYLPALLEGFLGSTRWMAARMGSLGGKSRSEPKVTASRENGKLGGRPRKRVFSKAAATLKAKSSAQMPKAKTAASKQKKARRQLKMAAKKVASK